MNDLRFAFRQLRKSPGFTCAAVLTLALGIGANSAIFSVVDAVLLHPPAYKNPHELVWVWATRKNVARAFYSIPNFTDTRAQTHALRDWIAFSTWGVNLRGERETERLQGIKISSGALQNLGVSAALGRPLDPNDENVDASQVAMLSYGVWQRRFGGDRAVVGSTQTLSGESYVVVGILPRNFVLPNAETDVIAPLKLEMDARRAERGTNFLRLMARLNDGAAPQQAQLELAAITERLRTQFPDDNGNLTAPRVLPLQNEIVGEYRQMLWIIFGAVAVVLLIGCANLASLQLARASARQREMAIRAAIGATRWRLLRQLLSEGIVLAGLGGALGLLLAFWGKDILIALAPSDFPRAITTAIGGPVLLLCLTTSVLAGVLLGLVPAFRVARNDLNADLKDGSRSVSGDAVRTRARNGLIVLEIALSLVLLVCAALLIKSFGRLQSVSPGFSMERALAVRLALPPARYSTGPAIKNFYDRLAPGLLALPGIDSVGAASALPMSALNARTEFVISGQPAPKPSDIPGAQHRWISPGYLHAMRIPLARGREFSDQDDAQGAGVVVIDQALARRFFAGQDPLGAHIKIVLGDNVPLRDYEIVGIAETVKHNALSEEPVPTFYGPLPQVPKGVTGFVANNFSIVVRTAVEAEALADMVRRELRALDPDVAVSSVKSMEQVVSASIASRKFNLILLGSFAGTALLLAAGGIYAVIAYLVSERKREIGVRLALGARRVNILRMIFGHALRLIVAGLTIGIVGAFAASRAISALLFNTSAADPWTYLGVAFLLTIVALFASYLPARRAMKINPIEALRYE